MPTIASSRFGNLDRIAMGLSGVCAIHCALTAVAVVLLSSVSTFLTNPLIHDVGLTIAMILGAIALGHGALHHGMLLPVAVGALGLGIMAGAMTLDHGIPESAYTILGVSLLAFGHELNRRAHW